MNENIQKLIDVVKTYTYKDTLTETEIDEIINNSINPTYINLAISIFLITNTV